MSGWFVRVRQRCNTARRGVRVSIAFVAALLSLAALIPAAAALSVQGGEMIVIDNISVGSPVMTTKSDCTGYVDHEKPVVPVTVEATFIVPPGQEPVGPYATSSWTGGYGSWDDHFNTGQAHSITQFFHILMTADPSYFYGQGSYTVSVTVQDVGVTPALTTEDKTVTLPGVPPSGGGAKVKCTPPLGPANQLNDLADAARDKVIEIGCPPCKTAMDAVKGIQQYSNLLDHFMGKVAIDDPPDANFQQIAQPDPPPLLPPPDGLDTTQQTAYLNLEQALADDIGLTRAIYTSENRVWGADDAASRYWYLEQLAAEADFATKLADKLDDLPPLFDDLQAAFAAELPPFSLSFDDVLNYDTEIASGFDADTAGILTQLGVSASEQGQMAAEQIGVDPDTMTFPVDGTTALFGQNFGDFSTPLRLLAKWADDAASAPAPVVASVDPRSIPAAGFEQVDIHGVNLQTVTGIDFGPSDPDGGEAQSFSCTATDCTAVAPPGHGTVDVVAVGPGGPSQINSGDQLTYTDPASPHVTQVFPNSGSTDGGTSVSVRGTGLSDGAVYFGATLAAGWQCTDTECTAESPESANPGVRDVTVVNGSGTSPIVPADQFTYLADAPPAPQLPVVTGVSPSHGPDSGGDQVTLTGSNFTDATQVDFGEAGEDWSGDFTVVDDSHIQATVPRDWNAPETVDVTVDGPGGSSAVSAADQYRYDAPAAPTITGVSPNTGPDTGGTQVTITGTDLGPETSFDFGSAGAEPSACTSTHCTVTAPERSDADSDGPVPVVAWNADGHSNKLLTPADTFTYTQGPLPVVTGVSPDTGPVDGGTDVAITGRNLGNGTVSFGGQEVGDATCTDTACVVTAPPSATHKPDELDVTVKTVAGTSATSDADVYSYVRLAAPAVDSIDPTSGWLRGGEEVHVYGSDMTGGTVSFGGATADSASPDEASCSQTECDVTAPAGTAPGPVHLTVSTASGTSQATSADEYSYLQPTITDVSPSTGWTEGGQTVTVTGTNLAGADIEFGTTDAGTPDCTDTSCTVTVPWTSSTGVVDIRAVQNSTRSPKTAADHFTYLTRPAPTVTGVTPNSGTKLGGDTVTITGTDLDGGAVRFGVAYVPHGSCGHTSCTVTTPAYNTVGVEDVTVTASGMTSATSSADQYTFRAPQTPTVTGISPSSGTTAGGATVTITGHDLNYGSVSFGTTPATGVACTAIICTATVPKHAAGTVDVTVTNGSGTSATSSADRYTYVTPAAPSITKLDPDYGPASGGSWVTITGAHLAGASVTFDGTPATGVTCTDDSCRATAPVHAAGAVALQVVTDGGTTSSQFRYTPQTLTEHHPANNVNAATEGNIVAGPDGDMWFAISKGDKIAKVAPDGTITTYPVADPPANGVARPFGITPGPDGLMWYAERNTDRIIAIDTSGVTQHDYAIPGVPGDLAFVTAGPDGRIWFSLLGSGSIGAITTDGTISLYHLPDPNVGPYDLVAGPDGRIWFTEVFGNAIGAITTAGKITEYPIPDADAQAWGISRGPDNRVWFAEQAVPALGAIAPNGTVTMYRLPPEAGRNPEGLGYGPDGRMWFGAPNIDQISALDPDTGAVSDYALPGGNGSEQPRFVGMAPDGTLWATEFGGPNVASISGVTAAVAPRVTAVTAGNGAAGDHVTLTGADLGSASAVHFGTAAATFTVTDPGHITAAVPAGSGTVDVTVTTPNGTSATLSADQFTYGPAPTPQPAVTKVTPDTGPASGGTTVTIRGSDLAGGTVGFGTAAATGVTCAATSCTATAPPGAAGTVDVTVTTAGGTSDTGPADQFTYLTPPPPAPVVTGVSPASGSSAGGAHVTITGTNLTGGAVTFGLDAATGVTCAATSCTATAPPGAGGVVHVRVTTAGGTSARSSADRYTYVAATKVPTATSLDVSPNPATSGHSVTLTAKVTPHQADGTVQFQDGSTDLGGAQPVYDYGTYGQAVLSVPNLAAGTHTLHAVFTPTDGDFYAASMGTASLMVGGTTDHSTLSIGAPQTVHYGSAVTVTGTLVDTTSKAPIPGATISLYRRSSAQEAWSQIGSRTTSATGAVSLKLTPRANGQYEWRYAGTSTNGAATSAVRSLSVTQVVVLHATTAHVRHGTAFRLYGVVRPPGAGHKVVLQRRVGKAWKSVTTATLQKQKLPGGTTAVGFVFSQKVATSGQVTYRVVSPATKTLAAGDSTAVTVTVT